MLRFIAAFMVVITHSTLYATERLDSDFGIWDVGARGVDIFFVISGFVIVIAAKGRDGSWVSPGSFAARRIVRIGPMYWLATTISLAILLAMPSLVLHSSLDWGTIGRSYLLIPDLNDGGRIEPLLGVGWTLYFETFFYTIFALSLFLRASPFIVVPVVLLAVSGASLFRTEDWPPVSVYLNPIVLEFLFGMLIAQWGRGARASKPVAMAFIVLGFASMFIARSHFDYLPSVLTRGVPSGIIVLGFVLLDRHVNWDRFRIFVFLGAASYVLYLFHPLISPAAPVVLGKLGLNNPWLSVLLSATIAVAFSAVLHRYIEGPVLAWMTDRIKAFEVRRRVPVAGE